MSIKSFFLILFLTLFSHLRGESKAAALLPSTESDPDAFIEHCVNVITGDYCEVVTDLAIAGPDALILQRNYSAKNYMTGKGAGGWRIFPQTFLVLGSDPSKKECKVGQDRFEWCYAFTGERSGSILSYSGWKKVSGDTKDPLKVDFKDTIGMSNSYAGEMKGQTNHLNNRIHFKQDTCEVILGDGTKRFYQKVKMVPTEIFGEEIVPTLASMVKDPQYFQLISETLPSGNIIFFSYDTKGHLSFIEMKNASQKNVHSWMRLDYDFSNQGCRINISTSDEKILSYSFEQKLIEKQQFYILKEVTCSYGISCSYDYEIKNNMCFLTKKRLPEGRFLEIEYDELGRVKILKDPSAESGKPEIAQHFSYEGKFTDVINAGNIKTRYQHDDHLRLIAIERFDQSGKLYRTDKKYYGRSRLDQTFLLARTISAGEGQVCSYRCFKYDDRGNVLEEKLFGNLTGKKEVCLKIDSDGQLLNPDQEECHVKTFGYSEDGLNLLIRVGDCKGGHTAYHYNKGTNLLSKKFIYNGITSNPPSITIREYRFYNDDGVCTKIVEDDGFSENIDHINYEYYPWGYGSKQIQWISKRRIIQILPRLILPGVGLPEIIEEKALDVKSNKELLIQKLVNNYSPQGNLLSCATYDSNSKYFHITSKTYNALGQVSSETDPKGKTTLYSYDRLGNQTFISCPHQNSTIEKRYDLKNNITQIIQTIDHIQAIELFTYDILNRKIASVDRYGQTTHFAYDAFGRLTQVTYPSVLDEYQKPMQPVFSYTYDILGNPITITDPKGYTIHKSYNLRGSPSKINYPDGTVEMFKYDTEGSLHRSLTRDKVVTVYEYDYLGRISYEEVSTTNEKGVKNYIDGHKYEYEGFNCIKSSKKTSREKLITEFRYDYAGRPTAIIQHAAEVKEDDPQSRKTEIFYDSLSRENKRKIWFDVGPLDFSVECFEYDLLGNIVEKRIESPNGDVLIKKGFAYDDSGKCIEEFNFSNGHKQTFTKTAYDTFGEPTSYIDASGNETKVIVDYAKGVLSKKIINPENVQTFIDFDALGRIVSLIKKDSKDQLLSSQSIFYDGIGNKSLEIDGIIVEGKQIGVQKTRWIYGPMGRLEQLIEAEGLPEERKTIYNYDSLGKMVAKTLPGVSVPITYTYDKEGRLTKVHYKDEKNESPLLNTYSYDAGGNIVRATTFNGNSVERIYNLFHQVTEEIVQDGEGKYGLRYQYDRRGRLKSIILPDGSSVAYTFDNTFGRVVKRLSSKGEELYAHHYTAYDASGKVSEETLIGYCGNKTTHYDANGRKTFVESDYYTETVPTTGYSSNGNLLIVQKKGDFPTENETYIYNALSQLTSEKKCTYAYNSIDNRLKENRESLLYSSLNQLTSHARAEYAYDSQGNLLKKALDGEETKFESNILSQLISIEKSDKTFLNFSYDPFGRRVVKKIFISKEKNKKILSITRSFYIGHQELGILDEKDNIKKLRIPGIAGNNISSKSIAIEINGLSYAVLHDITGNLCALIDPKTREIVESYNYSAFGNEKIYDSSQNVISRSAIGNHWRYAEKPIDEETGLIYFGFRYYDPTIGRWISKDPTGFVDGPNLYAYCHNNPLNYFDQYGLNSESSGVNEEYFYGEVEDHCYCEKHRACKRGGDLDKTKGTHLPTVTYCNDFEQMYPTYEASKLYDLGLKETENNGIGFINGVWNDFETAFNSADYISRLGKGHNIHAVYNATHGKYGDLKECRLGLKYVATEPVRLLHKMWNSYFEKSSAEAKFLMICHSQGAIHVRNALLDYPPELRERIIVVAIAPAAYIYQTTCAQVIHVRNESLLKDFVPRIDSGGAKRANSSIMEVKSHPEADLFDHTIISPTYRSELYLRINNFIKSGGREI